MKKAPQERFTHLLLLGLLALTLLYPFVHNTFLYAVNFTFSQLGKRAPATLNLFLIGSKDLLLILIMLILLGLKKTSAFFGALFIALICFLVGGMSAVKSLFEPITFLWVFLIYAPEMAAQVQTYQRGIKNSLLFIVFFLLAIGALDMTYRAVHHIYNDEIWTQFPYILANNEYRCAKYYLGGITSEDYFRCVTEKAAFYKLGIENGIYTAYSALYLPVGDTVVFSILLFYLFIFYAWYALKNKSILAVHETLILTLIGSALFFTLNRVNSLLCLLISSILFLVCLLKGHGTRTEKRALVLGVVTLFSVYFYKGQYLFFSIFNSLTPSNMGHMVILNPTPLTIPDQQRSNLDYVANFLDLSGIFSSYFKAFLLGLGPSLDILLLAIPIIFLISISRIWLTCYLVFIALFWWLSLRMNIPFNTRFGLVLKTTESDFVKALVCYGLVGVVIYSLILSFILQRMIRLFHLALLKRNDIGQGIRSLLLSFMGIEFIAYQFIAPYFISGYVVFFAFAGIWFILTEFELKGSSIIWNPAPI